MSLLLFLLSLLSYFYLTYSEFLPQCPQIRREAKRVLPLDVTAATIYNEFLLPSLSSYYSLHYRPIIERQGVGARNSDFIWKAGKLRWWWTCAPKNHLAWVRIQAPLILKGEGVKSNTSWFPSASRGDVLISSFLQLFTGGPAQDVSCELNKGILA